MKRLELFDVFECDVTLAGFALRAFLGVPGGLFVFYSEPAKLVEKYVVEGLDCLLPG